ncbi:hypothetical protein BGW38_006472, partial [Lunasporangiospora selenospora]
MFNSPLSNSSSCSSSPFSSPETGAEIDILDMPMFFPSETTSIYQQILDIDPTSSQQQQHPYHLAALALQQQQQQKQQQQYQYELSQIGLGTPPTSPAAPSFHKYIGSEVGTMFYPTQPQGINNPYVSNAGQQQALLQLQQLQEEQQAYQVLMQQFDNIEHSVFSPSPTTSSCSSSLSNSPYAESPLAATISSDFDLFPMNGHSASTTTTAAPTTTPATMTSMAAHPPTTGYPSAPVMAPSSTPMAQAMYGQQGYYNQMTPPMNQMDLEREVCSLFRGDANMQQPQTTELSLLCHCPGKFPCGEQVPEVAYESITRSSSPLPEIREDEISESESGSEEEQDSDPSYFPSAFGARSNSMPVGVKGSRHGSNRPKSMSYSTPYDSPFTKEMSQEAPIRQDRRRSSSGVYSSSGQSQLLDPEKVPEIKDIHVCPVCARRFTRPFNLRSHLMTHTTARPFPCDECHWKFTRQHDLLRHKRAKHPNSAVSDPTMMQKG